MALPHSVQLQTNRLIVAALSGSWRSAGIEHSVGTLDVKLDQAALNGSIR
jgi:hypothetical protein